jgi:hypothetical protein
MREDRFRVYENVVLGRIFGSRRRKLQDAGKLLHITISGRHTLHLILG